MPPQPSTWVQKMRAKAAEICRDKGSVCMEDLREYEAELTMAGIHKPHDRAYQRVFRDRTFKHSHDKYVPFMGVVGGRRIRNTRRVNCYILKDDEISWCNIAPFTAKCRLAGGYRG